MVVHWKDTIYAMFPRDATKTLSIENVGKGVALIIIVRWSRTEMCDVPSQCNENLEALKGGGGEGRGALYA